MGGAATSEVDSSYVPMLSNPKLVLDVIRTAAAARAEIRGCARGLVRRMPALWLFG